MLEEVTRLAFGQRRKKLRSSLRAHFNRPATAITQAGIDPNARAEELPVADFCRLATVLGRSAKVKITLGSGEGGFSSTICPKPSDLMRALALTGYGKPLELSPVTLRHPRAQKYCCK